MKILIIGGHLSPALGFLEALPKDAEVVYVGRQYAFEGDKGESLEYRTMQKRNIRFLPLKTGRLQRRISVHTIPSLLRIPNGIMEAYFFLKKEKPDVVVGFGGYLSVSVGVAAFLQHIPLVIHEQTLGAGLANKILSRFARKICVGWNQTTPFFSKTKTVVTGNPLPKDNPTKDALDIVPKGEKPLLVIVGGSGGSHAINFLVEGVLARLLEKFRVLHQTGNAWEFKDFERLQEEARHMPEALRKNYSLIQFIPPENITQIFKAADGVVGRSGMNTMTTLLLLEKKALFIPLPYGQKGEQAENARFYQKAGLGEVLLQREATSDSFFDAVTGMMKKQLVLRGDYQQYRKLHLHAGEELVKEVMQCIKKPLPKEKPVLSFRV